MKKIVKRVFFWSLLAVNAAVVGAMLFLAEAVVLFGFETVGNSPMTWKIVIGVLMAFVYILAVFTGMRNMYKHKMHKHRKKS